ncbi:MAG: hypothetical protein FJ295_08520 [Planctomycetes bacterium]|nr:hypothetical protein [Planctomycetota bacterium]
MKSYECRPVLFHWGSPSGRVSGRLLRILTVAVGSALLWATPCQAGPIWDFITGKSKSPPCANCGTVPVVAPVVVNPAAANYYSVSPAAAYYPLQPTVAAPASTNANIRGFAGYAPATTVQAYRPWANLGYSGAVPAGQVVVGRAAVPAVPAATAPICAACQRPLTVNIAPQVSYRTSWIQVPVTSYRPVAGFDPRTGQYVTVYQPCTSTTWQAQRVPTLIQRPIVVGNAPGMSGAACANGGCGVTVAPMAPYFGSPAAPAASGQLGPQGMTPADQRPSLPSSASPSFGPQIRNYAPAETPPSVGYPLGNARPLNGVAPSNDQSMRSLSGGVPSGHGENSDPSSAGTTNNSSSFTRPTNKSLVDPEGSSSNSSNSNEGVPPLLKSNGNRNASIPSPSSFGLIPTRLIQKRPQAQDQSPSRSMEPAIDAPQVAPQPKTRRLAPLDDSGWRAAPATGSPSNSIR